MPEGELTLPVKAAATPPEIERALYGRDASGRSNGDGVVGTWVAIVFAGSDKAPFQRVYLGSTHSVVFDSRSRTVATTPNLVPNIRRDEVLSRGIDPLATNSFYSFGLTAFEGVRRLLPNHYLDLDTFEVVRHWAKAALDSLADGKQGAAAIVEHSRQLLEVLSSRYDAFKVLLSAGRDSRAVLALLRPFVEEGQLDVLLSTTVGSDLGSRIDLQAARHLSHITDLPHEVKHRRKQDAADIDRMRAFIRIGEGRAGSILSAPGLRLEKRDTSSLALAGMAGEVARAFYWGSGELSEDQRSPEVLVKLTSGRENEAAIEAAEEWLKELPSGIRASAPDNLDLPYIEQRLGCWRRPVSYLFPGRRHALSPMAENFNIETMLRLPEAFGAAGVLQRDMVAYGWPELLEAPFNTPTGLLRVSWWARRLSRPINQARVHLGAVRRQLMGDREP